MHELGHLSRLRGSIGRLRRPFLEKNAEAELRLWRSAAQLRARARRVGEVYPLHQRILRKHPHPNLPRKRERERTFVVAKNSI